METIDRIFELADQRFKEQKDFASALGIAVSVVSAWKNKKSQSYMKRIDMIAETLGTTVEYLLTGASAAAPAGLSAEDAEILRQIHDRPGMRIMFSLTSKATDEDVEKAAKIIEAYLGTPEGRS